MKKSALLGIGLSTLIAAHSYALDWEAAKRNAGEVTVVNCAPIPLTAENGKFLKIPQKLSDAGAQIFVEANGKKTGNTADFAVTKEGWVLIAAHYGYEGNTQGNWLKERWDEKQFKKRGWQVLQKTEMGGPLVDKENREWMVFAKRLKAGETARMVTNKYSYPHIIVLTGSSTDGTAKK
jgi:hypothetical protein